VDRDTGAVVEHIGTSAVVCFVGYTPEGKPDTETAEYLCELHNANVYEPVGQERLPLTT